jgi:hypothetical protein
MYQFLDCRTHVAEIPVNFELASSISDPSFLCCSMQTFVVLSFLLVNTNSRAVLSVKDQALVTSFPCDHYSSTPQSFRISSVVR